MQTMWARAEAARDAVGAAVFVGKLVATVLGLDLSVHANAAH